MSLATTVSKVGYTLNSVPQTVAVPFAFQVNSGVPDFTVLDFRTDPPLTLQLNSDYSFTGGGYDVNNDLLSGSITVLGTGVNAVLAGDYITIVRTIPNTQPTSFFQTGQLTPAMIEAAFDKLTEAIQGIQETLGRCLQIEQPETLYTTLQLALRENKFLAFDTNGNPTFISGTGTILPVASSTTILSVSAYTGATAIETPPVHIDGINTALYSTPQAFFFVIGGRGSMWVLQASTQTVGPGCIQPFANSGLRFIQAF